MDQTDIVCLGSPDFGFSDDGAELPPPLSEMCVRC